MKFVFRASSDPAARPVQPRGICCASVLAVLRASDYVNKYDISCEASFFEAGCPELAGRCSHHMSAKYKNDRRRMAPFLEAYLQGVFHHIC